MAFERDQDHELDFVLNNRQFIEVKVGQASALEFHWFAKVFPRGGLTVIAGNKFETKQIKGITMADFLKTPTSSQPYD
ncbi:MAG: hypothetical protein HY547_08440 [Elusimicrobia bacterium]|nr:hypothetical protein [Elusimicrobiota bacterium]